MSQSDSSHNDAIEIGQDRKLSTDLDSYKQARQKQIIETISIGRSQHEPSYKNEKTQN